MSPGADAPSSARAREQTPRLDVLSSVLALLIEAGDLEQAAPDLLRELARGLGFDVATLWLFTQSGVLRRAGLYCEKQPSCQAVEKFEAATAGRETAGGEEFPPGMRARGEVTWIDELASAHGAVVPRSRAAAQVGLRSGVWLPVVSTKRVIGVIELFGRDRRTADPMLMAVLRTLGQSAGRLAERAQLEQELWDAEARFRRDLTRVVEERTQELAASRARAAERLFLVEATGVLLSSLDEARILSSLTEMAVPRLAHMCIIDVVPEGETAASGRLERAALSVAQPLVMRTNGATSEQSLPARVVLVGRADTTHSVTAKQLGTPSLPDGGPFVAVVVPLIARGQTLGALSLVSVDRDVSEDELAFVQDLGARVAFAIDNLRLVRRLQEAVGERDEFLSVAAHELRTPITTLKLQLDMMREHTSVSDARFKPRLERALRQTDRLERLIERLLDVSRIMSKPLELECGPMDLGELAADITEQLHEQATRAGCKVVVRAHQALGHWDHDRLEQVVTNLLLNAIQYGAGRTIEVNVSSTAQRARLSVTDHGIGIATVDVGRIFERFERAVSSHHYGGLGLGLFVAHQVVQAHGGEIVVDSTPGAGSTFTVLLPLAAQAVAAAPERRPEQPAAGPRSLILVVEDDVDAAQVVADLLGDHGFEVHTAADGREAFDVLRRGLRPALVLLDMMLPRMDGWQLMTAIKRDPQLAALPVVLFSAHADVARAAEELGAAGYLEKPLGVEALLSAIVRHANAHEAGGDTHDRQLS
jgi:signal transduction histidine kinase/ActR/RegA family two-component response regulator